MTIQETSQNAIIASIKDHQEEELLKEATGEDKINPEIFLSLLKE